MHLAILAVISFIEVTYKIVQISQLQPLQQKSMNDVLLAAIGYRNLDSYETQDSYKPIMSFWIRFRSSLY